MTSLIALSELLRDGMIREDQDGAVGLFRCGQAVARHCLRGAIRSKQSIG